MQQSCRPCSGGALLLASDTFDKKRLEVWVYHEGALVKLRFYTVPLTQPREIDGAIVCSAGPDTYVSLDGLEDAFVAWKARKAKAKRARPATK